MKRQKSCGPRLGKLVHQLLGVETFAYDLCFRRMIARWKDLSEKYNFWPEQHDLRSMLLHRFPKKHRLGPQNGSGSKKLLKIVNYQNCQKIVLSQLEKVGGHRYPFRSGLQVCDHIHQFYYRVTNHIWMMKLMRSFVWGTCWGTWFRQVVDELAHTWGV